MFTVSVPFWSRYDPQLARFQDLPPDDDCTDDDGHTPFVCQSCVRNSRREREKVGTPGSRLTGEESDTTRTYYRCTLGPYVLAIRGFEDVHCITVSPQFILLQEGDVCGR